MKTINATTIYEHAQRIKTIGDVYQAKIHLVGCYAAQTTDSKLRWYWLIMRQEYNKGLTLGSLWMFNVCYQSCCNIIYKIFGHHAWYNTLS